MTHFLRRFESVHQDFTWYTYIKVANDMKYKMVWPSSDLETVPDSWTQLNHHHENPSNKSKQIWCSYGFYKLKRHVFISWKLWPATLPPGMSSPTGCDPPNGKTSRVQAIHAPPPQGCFAAWLEILATKMVMVGDEMSSLSRNLSYSELISPNGWWWELLGLVMRLGENGGRWVLLGI